jgi:hypothetical protein
MHDTKGVTSSNEGIGYRSNTADLLRGFLDGPVPMIVHRLDDIDTDIKPRSSGESA